MNPQEGPYRAGPEQSAERCHRHPAAPAAATCSRCLQPTCELCVVYFRSSAHCAPCARSAKRVRLVVQLAALVLVIAAVTAGFFYVLSIPPAFDHGARAPLVRAARQKMEAERCDHKATLEYERELLRAGDNRAAIADVDAFVKACGDWYRVRWNSYEGYRRLNDNEHAVAEATKLIAHAPNDFDYRWWRGIAYEDLGKLAEAEADYRESIRILPSLKNIPFNLANVLERRGKPCEAKAVIEQFLHHHPEAADDEAVMSRVARLADEGHCDP